MEFVPNWQTLGFKTKEEGWKHVLGFLAQNRKKITAKSLVGEAVFQLGGQMFMVKGKTREEKKSY